MGTRSGSHMENLSREGCRPVSEPVRPVAANCAKQTPAAELHETANNDGGMEMKQTVITFQEAKQKQEKITMLTAYDYSTARLMTSGEVTPYWLEILWAW